MQKKIAYIMSRFPHLPETFILREMIALEKIGWQISLYPLIDQKQALIHQEAQAWVEKANRLPWVSGAIIFTNIRAFFKNPARFITALNKIIAGNCSSFGFLARALLILPKAIHMAKMMQREDIQHIHAHYATHPALAAWIIHQFSGITYSITVHAHDIFVDRSMLDEKLRGASKVIAISDFNRSFLVQHLGQWVEEKIEVIHCGISPDYYPKSATKAVPGNRLEIMTIGSLQPYKGQRFLVQACGQLKEKGIPFRCRIIGGGELKDELQSMIDANHLTEQIILLGPKSQQEVAQLLATASCYVQPSVIVPSGKMEGIPVALMEAMVNQIPVVASSLSGIPELVIDGETGWLVEPESAQQIASALDEIYQKPQDAERRAAQGKQLVLKEFDLNKNSIGISDLFCRIINK